jgi:hypothetical protein
MELGADLRDLEGADVETLLDECFGFRLVDE